MRARKPHVQRHDARLGAEADQRRDCDQRAARRRSIERLTSERTMVCEHEEGDPDSGSREVGHCGVDEDAPPRDLI